MSMRVRHFICDCPEGKIIRIGGHCKVCGVGLFTDNVPIKEWKNPDRDTKIYRLRERGMEIKAIVKKLGLSDSAIRGAIKRYLLRN